jgi:hypothetical protein
MSDGSARRPDPHHIPGGPDSEADLRAGADNSPDILQGIPEDEPELADVELTGPVPFRTPVPGARLTEEQLERDVE